MGGCMKKTNKHNSPLDRQESHHNLQTKHSPTRHLHAPAFISTNFCWLTVSLLTHGAATVINIADVMLKIAENKLHHLSTDTDTERTDASSVYRDRRDSITITSVSQVVNRSVGKMSTALTITGTRSLEAGEMCSLPLTPKGGPRF